ncbi:hypothetical protein BJ912DRAFT_926327 [Pholiota molesta]|nr:hypothetical protein BJ912DRAFT_926327 [Pholiota molesta]
MSMTFRISSTAKQDGVSMRRFKHIVDIVVQSGVVYSLALLVTAIGGVLRGAGDALNTEIVAFTLYISVLANCIAGMSATILGPGRFDTLAEPVGGRTSLGCNGVYHLTKHSASDGPELMNKDTGDHRYAGLEREDKTLTTIAIGSRIGFWHAALAGRGASRNEFPSMM